MARKARVVLVATGQLDCYSIDVGIIMFTTTFGVDTDTESQISANLNRIQGSDPVSCCPYRVPARDQLLP